MKLLLCPKGHTGASVFGKLIHFEYYDAGDERRYAFVTDAVAAELLKQEGYEVADPKSCPPELFKKLRVLKPDPQKKDTPKQNAITNYESSTSTVPTPIFVPAVWTTADASNYPVTMTWGDSLGNATSFVFTPDCTFRLCWLCRIKNWFQYRVFRKRLKSS